MRSAELYNMFSSSITKQCQELAQQHKDVLVPVSVSDSRNKEVNQK